MNTPFVFELRGEAIETLPTAAGHEKRKWACRPGASNLNTVFVFELDGEVTEGMPTLDH
ncbi:MAG: hypothetical protein WBV93_08275 [Anaerobacillus sp.]